MLIIYEAVLKLIMKIVVTLQTLNLIHQSDSLLKLENIFPVGWVGS